ncbi:hypothetical protein AB4Y40_02650 [Paraburkholderia sp. EG287B]|uniref:hypothetical protein n=1 Tax=Paraburkholderia sp. EG287B TaxID=3237010 RepID=UPI0034D2F968
MKRPKHFKRPIVAALIAMGVLTCTAYAADSPADPTSEEELNLASAVANPSTDRASSLGDFCFFSHLPPSEQKYKVIRKLKIGKGTYGSVQDILPKLAAYAQSNGADAIVEYTGSQRFGFWPWRMVRPVVRGVAVQWIDPKPVTCESIGGTTLSTILSSAQRPAK